MKIYQSNKTVLATPMNREEYNKYRGWKLPDDECGDDEGYLVEYPDSPNSNHTDHKGYISWSPKDVFERGNRSIDTHTDRVKVELEYLMDKLNKLSVFLTTDAYASIPAETQALLRKQYVYMSNYAEVLAKRLDTTVSIVMLKPEKVAYTVIESIKDDTEYVYNRVEGTNLTTCHIKLGKFVVGYGESSCLNDEDFNEDLGKKLARERAETDLTDKLWFAEGYARFMGYTA